MPWSRTKYSGRKLTLASLKHLPSSDAGQFLIEAPVKVRMQTAAMECPTASWHRDLASILKADVRMQGGDMNRWTETNFTLARCTASGFSARTS